MANALMRTVSPYQFRPPLDPRIGGTFQYPFIPGGYPPTAFDDPLDQGNGIGLVDTIGVDTPLGRFGVCPPGTTCQIGTFDVFGIDVCGARCKIDVGGVGDGFGEGLEYPTGNGVVPVPTNGLCCPKGKRPNRSGYFLKNGTYIAPGTKCVSYRKRNPLNPRAADRAIGRLRSASRFGKYLSKIELPAKGTKRR